MGSVQFQIAPHSSLHFSISTGPFRCSRWYLQGFYNLLHPSLLKRFPLFVWLVCWSLQCLISALTQAGGGGLLFGLLVPWRCGEGLALLSPSTLLRLPAALYGACPALPRFRPRVFTKARSKKLRLLFASSPSERLRQPGA